MARPTLNDVAELAGVAGRTVSRVINNEPNVSAKVKARVKAAVVQLGYIPDPAARSLASARSYMLGILFDNPSPHNLVNVQNGALKACQEARFHLVVETLDSMSPDLADQLDLTLANMRVDGVLLTQRFCDKEAVLDLLEARGMPYVRMGPTNFPDRAPSVNLDSSAAAAEIAHHLWSLGHRRFAIVNGSLDHGSACQRREGFLTTLQTLGAESVVEAEGHFRFADGIEAGLKLFALNPRPTAIFAANDDSAAGVLSAALRLGIRVPEDLSIIGFDDTWIATSVWPYLTTMHQPIPDMAYAAARMLIESHGIAENQTIMFPFNLVERDSTAPPPSLDCA